MIFSARSSAGALAAPAAEERREAVTEDARRAAEDAGEQARCRPDPRGEGPLARVEYQNQRRQRLVAGTQHIGRPYIARPDVAQVAQPE